MASRGHLGRGGGVWKPSGDPGESAEAILMRNDRNAIFEIPTYTLLSLRPLHLIDGKPRS